MQSYVPPMPVLDRELRFRGDWGWANFHRVCGWLSGAILMHAGHDQRVSIVNGRGHADNVRAVAEGEADLAVTTPPEFLAMAREGTGLYAGTPLTNLRAIGRVPQDDRLVVAVRRDAGIASIAEIAARKLPLRIATSPNDGTHSVGYAVHELLRRSDVDPAAFVAWGGSFVEHELPFPCMQAVTAGRADAVIHEAIMHESWDEMFARRDMVVLPVEDAVLAGLEADLKWPRGVLPANFFAGQTEAVTTLDFTDFAVIVRDDMPDDLAEFLGWAFIEQRHVLEAWYRHLPVRRSQVTWPLMPHRMVDMPIPIHPGARRYYERARLLPPL